MFIYRTCVSLRLVYLPIQLTFDIYIDTMLSPYTTGLNSHTFGINIETILPYIDSSLPPPPLPTGLNSHTFDTNIDTMLPPPQQD